MSAFTECLPKRPRTVVPGDVSTRSTGRLAGQAEEAFGVRCNDVLVCSATLAIKYKYAIKQTRTAGHMHYYSGPQLVEIFARKRRHKLRNMAHLAAQKRNARKQAGRDAEGGSWQGSTKSKTKAILNASSSIGGRRHANT